MPSRLLREGILDSAAVNDLTFAAEVFYRRLMSVVDDFGRFDGRPAVLRGRLYSLKLNTVGEAEIIGWLSECEKVGLVVRYEVDAKPYLLFTKLGPARAKESKYPPPPLQAAGASGQHTDVNGCAQTKTSAPYSYSGSYSDTGSGAAGAEGGVCADENNTVGPNPAAVTAHWNAHPGLLPCVASEVNRDRMIRSWATQNPLWVMHWKAAIAFMGRTPFYCGGGNRGWRPDLGWLLQGENLVKVVEQMLAEKSGPRAPPGNEFTPVVFLD